MNKDSTITSPGNEYAAYELLPCGVVCTDVKQQITFVNKVLLKQLGFAEGDLVGERRFYELLSVGGKLYFETHFSPALEFEGEIGETSFEMVDKVGKRHPVIVNVRRVESGSAGFIYVVFSAEDRKKFEQDMRRARMEAETADRAKTTFISSMSHEIRTPLHAILEAGNFLFKDSPRPDQLEFIQVLRGAGNSLLSIVNDILDISKLEAGMATLDERPVHADQLVKQVVDTYGPTCRRKGVELRSILPLNRVPLLLADGGKLIQVLNNLVSNAVKFTDDGVITVSLAHEEKEAGRHALRFRIRDSGKGIAEDRLEHIFKPFVQADETIHTDFGGTGLGLAICKKIVEACGSDLKVESKLGEGTEFSFTLSLDEASKAQRAKDRQTVVQAEELPPLNHLRVLNVDDNPSNLLINARYFSDWKLAFDQVKSGREALELIDQNTYDIVLLDLRMPDMDGYDLARLVRAHSNPAVNNLPLIALSASASKDVSADMLDAGINGLVVKPFEPAYLHHIIRRYGEQEVKRRVEERKDTSTAESQKVDFSQVREIFAGDDREYRNFLQIIKTDVINARVVLTECSKTLDKKQYSDLNHNMISTLRVFLKDDMAAQFEKGKKALANGDDVAFIVVVDGLIAGFRDFEAGLDRELAEG